MIEKKGGGRGKGWRSRRVNPPRTISSDLSIPLFRATVSLNSSIKVCGYQIPPLIDFPKPSASRWENLKVMLLSTQRQTRGLMQTVGTDF